MLEAQLHSDLTFRATVNVLEKGKEVKNKGKGNPRKAQGLS